MKRAAFLSFDWDFEVMSAYYEGMQDFLGARDDLQLVIFNAFGQYANYEPEEGAFEVFSLCDYERYDGFIIQGNRSWPPALRQRVADEIHALGKPVVSINYELAHAHCVGTNNYAAMRGLVSRVLSDTGCTRPAFVNGLATSWEAQARARGWRHACAELGITDTRFYQANWEMDAGRKTARAMLEEPGDLPDVIFCCNDDLAVGVQETLQAHGVRIPEEVMVAGFDNRETSLKASPRITTIDRDYAGIGRTALGVLERLMNGEEQPLSVASDVRYVLAESCGYENGAESKEDLVSDLSSMDAALKHFYRVLTHFQPAVLNADSLYEILLECERTFGELKCPNTYLMINDNYFDQNTIRAVTSYGPLSLLMAYGGAGINLVYDNKHIYARFLSRNILPPEIPLTKPVYMVFPLRHGTTCIGTLVTEGVSPILKYGFMTIVLTLLSSAIESARKKEMLQAVNARLDDLYVRDQLTGLFNRFGLERFGAIVYDHLLRDFNEAQFIFMDVDNMKQINDSCGHEIGDQALQDTADIIHRATRDENAFAMRYGGDEFLLICRRNLIPKLEAELQMMRDNSTRPYELSLSMGRYQVFSSDRMPIHEAVERADARMYQSKQERRGR